MSNNVTKYQIENLLHLTEKVLTQVEFWTVMSTKNDLLALHTHSYFVEPEIIFLAFS
jgi:hypothetical protein